LLERRLALRRAQQILAKLVHAGAAAGCSLEESLHIARLEKFLQGATAIFLGSGQLSVPRYAPVMAVTLL
jgi:hypothetical protein